MARVRKLQNKIAGQGEIGEHVMAIVIELLQWDGGSVWASRLLSLQVVFFFFFFFQSPSRPDLVLHLSCIDAFFFLFIHRDRAAWSFTVCLHSSHPSSRMHRNVGGKKARGGSHANGCCKRWQTACFSSRVLNFPR